MNKHRRNQGKGLGAHLSFVPVADSLVAAAAAHSSSPHP